jgi:MFS family permease
LLAVLAYILRIGLSGSSATSIFAGLIACRTLHGALTTGVLPATQAHLADRSDAAGRVGGMAAVSIAFGLGSLIGPGVVGLLAPFVALAGLWCLSIVAILLAIVLGVIPAHRKSEFPVRPNAAEPLNVTPTLIRCLVVSSCFHIAFLGAMQIAGFIVQDRFHYSASSAVSLASYAFFLIAVAMIRFKSDRAGSLIVGGSLIGCAGYASALLDYGLLGAVLAPALLGVSLALVLPSVSAVASLTANAHGAALGAIGATQAVGFLVGPLLASYLYSIGHSLPLVVDSAILLLCALVATALPRRLQLGVT